MIITSPSAGTVLKILNAKLPPKYGIMAYSQLQLHLILKRRLCIGGNASIVRYMISSAILVLDLTSAVFPTETPALLQDRQYERWCAMMEIMGSDWRMFY
jgi:hypothetical protein